MITVSVFSATDHFRGHVLSCYFNEADLIYAISRQLLAHNLSTARYFSSSLENRGRALYMNQPLQPYLRSPTKRPGAYPASLYETGQGCFISIVAERATNVPCAKSRPLHAIAGHERWHNKL